MSTNGKVAYELPMLREYLQTNTIHEADELGN